MSKFGELKQRIDNWSIEDEDIVIIFLIIALKKIEII